MDLNCVSFKSNSRENARHTFLGTGASRIYLHSVKLDFNFDVFDNDLQNTLVLDNDSLESGAGGALVSSK